MKRYVSFLVLLMTAISLQAQDFQQFFNDSTLRLDYIFAGDKKSQHIYLDQLHKSAGWYGRRHHLDQLPLEGNGDITMKDAATGTVIYRHSFSTLFQEWLSTAEARQTSRSFENVFLVPYPR